MSFKPNNVVKKESDDSDDVIFIRQEIDLTQISSSTDYETTTGADPGFPTGGRVPTLIGGGTNLQHRHFSVKTYVKMKEFGPVGGGGVHTRNFCI